ncbi:hypothetical protein [Priestia koreensis]|uniref:hypothetical protein n=1 Tax=Priestia koreensis TaxID=284581 RepID=UPI003457FD11
MGVLGITSNEYLLFNSHSVSVQLGSPFQIASLSAGQVLSFLVVSLLRDLSWLANPAGVFASFSSILASFKWSAY